MINLTPKPRFEITVGLEPISKYAATFLTQELYDDVFYRERFFQQWARVNTEAIRKELNAYFS